jgi:hypothetical protein
VYINPDTFRESFIAVLQTAMVVVVGEGRSLGGPKGLKLQVTLNLSAGDQKIRLICEIEEQNESG